MATGLGLHVGARIQQAREEAGLRTQQDLADKLPSPINNQYVSKWEGGVKPKEPTLQLIADVLDREVSWFYEGFQKNGETPEPLAARGDQLDHIETTLALILGVLERQVGADVLEAVRQDMSQEHQEDASERPSRAA